MSTSGRGGRGDVETGGAEPDTGSVLASGFSSTAGWSVPSAVDMRWRAPGSQSASSTNGGFTGTSGLTIQSGIPSSQPGLPSWQSQPGGLSGSLPGGLSGSGNQASAAVREISINLQPFFFIVTLMFLLMLLSFPQASEFLLWVFIGAFVAAMLRGFSLYRHVADQARAQRAFARLLGLPPSSTSLLLSSPFGPPFSAASLQPLQFPGLRGGTSSTFPPFGLSPFPVFPSYFSPSISPSSSFGSLAQSEAARPAASAGAESAGHVAAAAGDPFTRAQPTNQPASELGREWFGGGGGSGANGGLEAGQYESALAARIGTLVRAQYGQQNGSRPHMQQQSQPQQQQWGQQQGQDHQQQQQQQGESDRMWLEHQVQLQRLQRHLGLQLALMHRELQASDYELLQALDADNSPMVPALSDQEIARLPAFPYKPKRSLSRGSKPRLPAAPAPLTGAAASTSQPSLSASVQAAASGPAAARVASGAVVSAQQGKEEEESGGERCTVCLEAFQEGEMVRLLPCLHQFHSPCIDQWLQRQANCPICKHQLVL